MKEEREQRTEMKEEDAEQKQNRSALPYPPPALISTLTRNARGPKSAAANGQQDATQQPAARGRSSDGSGVPGAGSSRLGRLSVTSNLSDDGDVQRIESAL